MQVPVDTSQPELLSEGAVVGSNDTGMTPVSKRRCICGCRIVIVGTMCDCQITIGI